MDKQEVEVFPNEQVFGLRTWSLPCWCRKYSHCAWLYSIALARDTSVAKSRDDPLCPALPSLAAQHSTLLPSKRESLSSGAMTSLKSILTLCNSEQ